MKKMRIWPLLLIGAAILLAVVIVFAFGNKQVNYDELTEVSFCYLGPSGGYEYGLILQDGIWVASSKEYEELDVHTCQKPVNEQFVKQIKQILSDNNVHEWDGFDEEDKSIIDGDGFTFYMRFSNGAEINAHGYMNYPINFKKVWNVFYEQYQLLNE